MSDLPRCSMRQVVRGLGDGAVFDLDSGCWLKPCPDPVAGLAREDGQPYCSWHLELMNEPPLMWCVVTPGGIKGPYEDPEP